MCTQKAVIAKYITSAYDHTMHTLYTSSHLIADQFSNVISSVRPAQYTWMSDHVHLETAGIISLLQERLSLQSD